MSIDIFNMFSGRLNRSIAFYTFHLHVGYTMRKIEPAKNYDVVSFARAMNDDFAPRLKKLFDPETEAAVEAQKTGTQVLCSITANSNLLPDVIMPE